MEADHTFSNNTVHCIFSVKKPAPEKKIYQKGCNCRQSFPKDSIPNIYNTSLGFFPWFDSSASLQEALKYNKKGEKDLEKSDIYFSIQI